MTGEKAYLDVDRKAAGDRLDTFLAARIDSLTRSQAERLAKSGRVRVDGRPAAPGRRLNTGERVEVSLPAPRPSRAQPEEIPLDIFFEDEHIIVVNKPRGMVVHPGAGRHSGTLVNALLAHTGVLAQGRGPLRPGLVHRLDRDTTGLIVAAKTDEAFENLAGQVRRRELERRYLALVWGTIEEDRLVIDAPIGRHPREGLRMVAVPGPPTGRKVRRTRTDVIVLDRLGPMTLVEARLGTGRTHQIRVHLAHQGHPIVGDPTYGVRKARRERAALDVRAQHLVESLGGQALHAQLLRFHHPATGQELTFAAPLPPDMAALVGHLSAAGGGPVEGQENRK